MNKSGNYNEKYVISYAKMSIFSKYKQTPHD